MAQDLMNRYHLTGMAREEVFKKLGRPDSTLERTYHYFLRPDTWGDAQVLEINFNIQGRVIEAKISNN